MSAPRGSPWTGARQPRPYVLRVLVIVGEGVDSDTPLHVFAGKKVLGEG